MRKTRSKRTKILQDLTTAYRGAKLIDEPFIWDIYRDMLRDAARTILHHPSTDPVKKEKQTRILMLELHLEVYDQA